MKKAKQHGGARKGAGRKPGKETVTLSFRVHADKSIWIKEKILDFIKKIK